MFVTRNLIVLGMLVWAGICHASPPLAAIRDTLYKADGTRFEGMAQIEWKTFVAADGSQILQNTIQVRVENGVLNVDLVPTTNAKKPGYYTVRFNAEGRTQFVEFWSVPQSAAPLQLSDIRTHVITAGQLTSTPVTVTVQDVSGLRTELDLRPQRGAGWISSRTAIIGQSGALEAAIGDSQSCVRVDGTPTPCGFAGITYIDNEVPLGAVNGVNRHFTLSAPPTPSSSLAVYLNGVLQRQGTEYSLAGNVVTFSPSHVPLQTDQIVTSYRVNADSGMVYVDMEVPTGPVDGMNPSFTLSSVPMPASSLHLYRNGLLQKQGFDYNFSVHTITFLPGATPQPGDTLLATYRK